MNKKTMKWMDGWMGKLMKMINDQNNEMKEWTLKFWNDWMDGWKNKRKEVMKKWMNEWMDEKNEILKN